MHLLTAITFLPALGALALLLLRGDDHVWIRRLALTTALAEFALSLLLIPGVRIGASGYGLEEFHTWIKDPSINYHLGVDGISLFLFFLFWEVMLLPMYFLIGIWGHERRIYAAVKFVLYTMAGSILMLVGILWLHFLAVQAGAGAEKYTFDLPVIQQMLQTGLIHLSPFTEMLLFGAFFVAFAIKVPLFPLHTWLPDAHVEAPTAGSVILAGVLLKMGTYGMLRFCLPLFPEASHKFAPAIAALAIIGILY